MKGWKINRRSKKNKPVSLKASTSTTYDLIVIGGGSAGLTAAKFAATFDKSVCLVEANKVGGDCTWSGCVPSKTLLSAAKRAYTWQQMNDSYGNSKIDDTALRRMLQDVKKDIDEKRNRIYEEDDSPKVLQSLGIDLAQGKATFRDEKTIDVSNDLNDTSFQLNAKYGIVIATGAASPRDPKLDIKGLETVPYWTYENVWNEFFLSIDQNPTQQVTSKRIVIVGGGPIGCELSQAISKLGCSVTLISSNRLLPTEEVEASTELQEVFEKEGIQVICNQRVESVSKSDDDGLISVALTDSEDTIVGDHISGHR